MSILYMMNKEPMIKLSCKIFYVFIYFYFYFIYSWLCWVFVAAHGLSPVAASGGYSSCSVQASHCSGFSCCGSWALGAVFSSCGMWASVVVALGLRCSAACGIFPDQGSNPCPLHRQADSYPLRHQENPASRFKKNCTTVHMWGYTIPGYFKFKF